MCFTILRGSTYSPGSKRRSSTSAAMRVSKPSQSKAVINPAPDLPARSASENSALPMPIGVTTPMPVMATRSGISVQRCTSKPDVGHVLPERLEQWRDDSRRFLKAERQTGHDDVAIADAGRPANPRCVDVVRHDFHGEADKISWPGEGNEARAIDTH